MEITNEARVDSFSIGPSTLLGRTIAFRVLFCTSITHLRHHLLILLRRLWAAPLLSWFHPKNTQGILVMVTIIAFLLKRFTNVRSRAESAYRRKFWRNMMRSALTYEEWAHAAKMLDKGAPRMNESDLYDEELVRNKLQELRHRREEGSLRDIVFCMRADLLRNLGNMCNPELHKERLQVGSDLHTRSIRHPARPSRIRSPDLPSICTTYPHRTFKTSAEVKAPTILDLSVTSATHQLKRSTTNPSV